MMDEENKTTLTETAKHSLDAAQRVQEKFTFYIVTLSFTLLGLAIQTAEFSDPINMARSISELSGWILLMASGLAGLARFEKLSAALHMDSKRREVREGIKNVKDELEEGNRVTVKDSFMSEEVTGQKMIRMWDELKSNLNKRIEDASTKVNRRYLIQKWTLVVGLFCLIVSRGWGPGSSILESAYTAISSIFQVL